jgi:hypothetical protein
MTALADEVAAGAGSLQFATLAMDITGSRGQHLYRYCANVATWIAQGANPTATAGAGSMYVPAGSPVLLDGFDGAKLAVIEDGSAGKANLVPVLRV